MRGPERRNISGGGDSWVPLAAGVVVGVGILALIYKLFFSGSGDCAKRIGTPVCNKQMGAPFACTCKKGESTFQYRETGDFVNFDICQCGCGNHGPASTMQERSEQRARRRAARAGPAPLTPSQDPPLDKNAKPKKPREEHDRKEKEKAKEQVRKRKALIKKYAASQTDEDEFDWGPYLKGGAVLALVLCTLAYKYLDKIKRLIYGPECIPPPPPCDIPVCDPDPNFVLNPPLPCPRKLPPCPPPELSKIPPCPPPPCPPRKPPCSPKKPPCPPNEAPPPAEIPPSDPPAPRCGCKKPECDLPLPPPPPIPPSSAETPKRRPKPKAINFKPENPLTSPLNVGPSHGVCVIL